MRLLNVVLTGPLCETLEVIPSAELRSLFIRYDLNIALFLKIACSVYDIAQVIKNAGIDLDARCVTSDAHTLYTARQAIQEATRSAVKLSRIIYLYNERSPGREISDKIRVMLGV